MTQALQTAAMQSASASVNQSQSEVLKSVNKTKEKDPVVHNKDASAPLDLTVRKSPELGELVIDEQEKENIKQHRESPQSSSDKMECIIGSPPSTPHSQTVPSPSPKRKFDQIDHSSQSSTSPSVTRSTPKLPEERLQTSPDGTPAGTIPPPFNFPAALHPFLNRGKEFNKYEIL